MWMSWLNGLRTVCWVGYHGNMFCRGTDFMRDMFSSMWSFYSIGFCFEKWINEKCTLLTKRTIFKFPKEELRDSYILFFITDVSSTVVIFTKNPCTWSSSESFSVWTPESCLHTQYNYFFITCGYDEKLSPQCLLVMDLQTLDSMNNTCQSTQTVIESIHECT